jgi:hypothetical protein
MTTIHVFEPALCCNTGVCGPDTDESLVSFTADLAHLKELGVDIERHNLANDPMAFVESDAARAFLDVAGSDGLPLTVVDGVTVAAGAYPDREALLRFAKVGGVTPPAGTVDLGLTSVTASVAASAGGGCCGSGGCC